MSLQQFTADLRVLAEDWRWSDEYIGLWVRSRWPRVYDFGRDTIGATPYDPNVCIGPEVSP